MFEFRYILASLVLILFGLISVADADSIRLHDQAMAATRDIRLSEVAEIEGEVAQRFGDVVVATFSDTDAVTKVSLRDIRKRLNSQGANWAGMSLRGYASCEVHLKGAGQIKSHVNTDGSMSPEAGEGAGLSDSAGRSVGNGNGSIGPAAANPDRRINLRSPMTVRERIVEWVEIYTGTPRDELRIDFNPRQDNEFNASAWTDRFVIEDVGKSRDRLGSIMISVIRYRGNERISDFKTTLTVARRALAVVAARAVRPGQTFAPGDVKIEEVYLQEAGRVALGDTSVVVGQRCARTLRKGMVVYADQVEAPLAIRRGEILDVRSRVGDLVIKISCRAAENGAIGDVISVRNLSTNQNFNATVTGSRQADMALSFVSESRQADAGNR